MSIVCGNRQIERNCRRLKAARTLGNCPTSDDLRHHHRHLRRRHRQNHETRIKFRQTRRIYAR